MTFELTKEDAEFLHEQLVQHTHEVTVELAHTEKRELQRVLAKDLARLQRITALLAPGGGSVNASI
jgi:hypothetical protein